MKAIRNWAIASQQKAILGSRWGFTRTLDEWVQSVTSQFTEPSQYQVRLRRERTQRTQIHRAKGHTHYVYRPC